MGSREVGIVFVVSILALTLMGFYGLAPDFKVDVEYMSGMLTASSIIFGFWVVLIQTEKLPAEVYEIFFFSFTILIFSVASLFLAACGRLWSTMALWICMITFMINATTLAVTIYYYKLKG